MYYSSELQAEAVQTLLKYSGMQLFREPFLFENGKATSHFWKMYDDKGELAHGERVLIEAVLDFWNGHAHTDFTELFYLDQSVRSLVFSLYEALCDSEQIVKKWIKESSTIDPRACLSNG